MRKSENYILKTEREWKLRDRLAKQWEHGWMWSQERPLSEARFCCNKTKTNPTFTGEKYPSFAFE